MRDKLVTIFGGSGFVGRYVAQELLERGVRLRIAERDPRDAYYLRPLAKLGQTQRIAVDIRNPDLVARAVDGVDGVVNLVGGLKGDLQGLHVDGAATIAKASAAAGVGALVHLSAIGADANAASRYARTKGDGEAAVRAAYPGATILRPSIIFGREDRFVNRFAAMMGMPVVPVLRASTRFQPVFVGDVAEAVARAVEEPGTFGGRTFELGGPDVMSMADLIRFIAHETCRTPMTVELPDALGGLIASAGFLPGAPITRDQWAMLQRDNVVSADASGFRAFGIEPRPLAAVAPGYLVLYRRNGRFGTRTQAA